jgi:hypothetical protein
MRTIVRYLLILGSLGMISWVSYMLYNHRTGDDVWLGWAMLIGHLTNAIYLATDKNRRPLTRFSRLFELWLDAKEAELRAIRRTA